MKSINYFLLAMCMGLAHGISDAQETYVTGTAKVKVQPNTLVYFGDNLNVTSTTNAVFENAGNVKIDGDYVNPSATGANFVSTWDVPSNNTSYGQVIINEASSSDRLTMEKGTIDPAVFNWGQFAMPFHFANVDEAMGFLFGTSYSSSNNRYQKSMMAWDNVQKPEFDHFNAGATLDANSPTAYYILNLEYNSGNIKSIMEANDKLAYRGVASNEAFLNIPMNTNMYHFGGVPWSNWKGKKNTYNEKYQTYIDDKVRTVADDAGYGRNFFQFGNPYTSNIDLAYIGSPASPGYDDGNDIDGLLAVARVADLSYDGSGSTSSAMVVATYNEATNVWGGDASALLVKPFEPFIVVLNTAATNTGNRTINFSDKLKTFSMTPNSLGSGVTTSKNTGSDGGEMNEDGNGFGFSSTSTVRPKFYQLGLNLYKSNGAPAGNKAYVIVTNSGVTNGTDNALESEYSDFNAKTGFFLAQENLDGTPVPSSTRKMHINAVNMAYVNKPIPVFFNRKSGDLNGYYVKADLFYQDIFTKVSGDETNFVDGNSFFFYDRTEDVLMPITTEFNYYVDVSEKQVEDRYTVYWNGGPAFNKGEMELDETLASATVIYKDQQTHKIRFSDQWNSADIKVYDMSGRNIMSYKNVNTQADFELKLPNTGVYIVKAESNTGDVYTQKIIK
ncbi:T9SS type A sorting domain-containing protein [Moheibacter lacus]|uniref:T9SS type A sorting domain-containing protein n=1 Tax=Moheibacter lacus TaxID=2745851 RepID=A0A838ZIU2_9FLAO|nr:T9SS type A sorting domain-containing protein [Moheibacter lacus]MBA5628274.1 T9SS type A sorting domain-containing protein [Moheibacter lacus]